jgi:hypothetical protein
VRSFINAIVDLFLPCPVESALGAASLGSIRNVEGLENGTGLNQSLLAGNPSVAEF